MPSGGGLPLINAQQAARATLAAVAVATQPAVSIIQRGIRRHVGTSSRDRTAASRKGMLGSHSVRLPANSPATPAPVSPSVPPMAHHVLSSG